VNGTLPPLPAPLAELAATWGVQPEYVDALGQRRRASADSVVAVLRALGAPIQTVDEAPDALRARIAQREAEVVEPVCVAWDGRGEVRVRRSGRVVLVGRHESGERWEHPAEVVDGAVALPELRLGVHRVTLEADGAHGLTILAAPSRCHEDDRPGWGVFAPLYALHDAHGRFADLGTLRRAGERVRAMGGDLFGTLPLLAGFFEEARFEPSPYAPVTRRMWNELFLELGATPEMASSPEARRRMERTFEPIVDGLVDYRAAYAHRAAILEALAEACPDARLAAFLERHPDVDRYARFRASAATGPVGALPRGGDAAWEARRRFHAYAQMCCEEQLAALAERTPLYLDLPLGVHGEGFDAWEHGSIFAKGVGAGAPPDALFEGGQSWGFPPLLPEASRASGYEYLRQCLDAHTRHAGMLRIDHVAWLNRLFWVPAGADATEGLYVHNPRPEEHYALVTLASRSNRCRVVGEDLGTVPDAVRQSMTEHGLRRTWVFQFEVRDHPPLWSAPPPDAVLTINTHDTPTFEGWWSEQDVDDRVALGLYDEGLEATERAGRRLVRDGMRSGMGLAGDATSTEVLAAVLPPLAAGPGELLLLTMEDLWGERMPQNTPGTSDERPNWRRHSSRPLEALDEGRPKAILEAVAKARGHE